MNLYLCRHIRTNGLQCQGVALTASPFCYFHDRLHKRHVPYRFTAATKGYLIPGQHIQLGPLEDRDSIQVALSQVINALATGSLEIKRATALLYGLQLASANAAGLHPDPRPLEAIRDTSTTPEESETPGVDLARPGIFYDTDDCPEFPQSAPLSHEDPSARASDSNSVAEFSRQAGVTHSCSLIA